MYELRTESTDSSKRHPLNDDVASFCFGSFLSCAWH